MPGVPGFFEKWTDIMGFLYVAPLEAPSQMALPEAERDMNVARRMGAEWAPGSGAMVPGQNASREEIASLAARFGGRRARIRAEAARAEIGPMPSWRLMALAACAEVRRCGGEAARSVPSTDVEREDRLYLFSVPVVNSPFSTARLDVISKRDNIPVYRDDISGIAGMGRGLRYVDAGTRLPDDMRVFASDEARAARRDYEARRTGFLVKMASIATLVGRDGAQERGEEGASIDRLPARAMEKAPRRDVDRMMK